MALVTWRVEFPDPSSQPLKSPSSNFRADPSSILESTTYMANFQKTKKIKTKVSTDGLFDTSIYKEAKSNLGK